MFCGWWNKGSKRGEGIEMKAASNCPGIPLFTKLWNKQAGKVLGKGVFVRVLGRPISFPPAFLIKFRGKIQLRRISETSQWVKRKNHVRLDTNWLKEVLLYHFASLQRFPVLYYKPEDLKTINGCMNHSYSFKLSRGIVTEDISSILKIYIKK